MAIAIDIPVAAASDPSPEPSARPPAEVVIAGPGEPGTPLHVEGSVIDGASGAPIDGAAIVLYHADDRGRYEPVDPSDESTARLRADLVSAPDGSFVVRTILPGEYPDQPPGNRHIHVHSVEADGYAPRGFVILFDDNVRDEVRAWAAETGFGQVIELAGGDAGLSGFVEIRLEPLAEPGSETELAPDDGD